MIMDGDRFRPDTLPDMPEDDGYDHDMDDPEFYHFSEEFEDELEESEFDPEEWGRDD